MASAIIITVGKSDSGVCPTDALPPPHAGRLSGRRQQGFSLLELMIATVLTGLIVAAATSSFLFLTRGLLGLEHYLDMEKQARYALEYFARDARSALDITGISGASDPANIATITLTVPTNDAGATTTVVYGWDSAAHQFYRRVGGASATATPLMSNVRLVRFTPYKLTDPHRTSNLAATDLETDQIQIRLEAEKTTRGVGRNTNVILSARYILRNKPKTD